MIPHSIAVSDLDVERVGSGPTVVLVHGSIVGARQTWRKQRSLGSSWTLVMPNRPGFGDSPPLERGDFAVEAELIAELLGEGAGEGEGEGARAHLIGHSYGAVIALLAAASRPACVRSLIVSEPGLLRLAAGDPAADAMVEGGERLYRVGAKLPPAEFLRLFRTGVHSTHETPEALPLELERGVMLSARERPPWHADVPFERLAAATFPKLVISGNHSPVFETVCDVVAERIGARRTWVTGRGHTIPATGEAYNDVVHDVLSEAEAARHRPL
jgi:pimeloyl-ACP methyl ester carboxylesterase